MYVLFFSFKPGECGKECSEYSCIQSSCLKERQPGHTDIETLKQGKQAECANKRVSVNHSESGGEFILHWSSSQAQYEPREDRVCLAQRKRHFPDEFRTI